MTIRIYAINLDRSADRWARLSKQAAELNLELVRIRALDGAQIPAQDWINCNEQLFWRNNGRTILPGEYGCYRSHLKTLSAFLEEGEPIGIVAEDDIELNSELAARVQAAFEALPQAEVIKLCNHRIVWFNRFATTALGDDIGRAGHGPQGSTACYAVTRVGATKLIDRLRCMEYPWDIALERGWATGIEVYTTQRNVVVIGRYGTTIANRSVYRGTKFPWWRRLSAHVFRTIESARRLGYALRGRFSKF